ncbi:HD domain-containing protein [Pustulibacterium marinum]|uniref:HD domain-containing protein n=1 Tax=Pustulibacterium marinum TaxID=1224947 RepID=A0A1I7IN78_9FLAO|nr:HD domain-containing protein [Pustulibacterium marinum]SFU74380.1 HD domain-containing protein [Pustulibacterium marinum]
MRELQAIKTYVEQLYTTKAYTELVYHNLKHTQQVVKRVQEMAMFYGLDQQDQFIVSTAAWFHDCGHLFGETTLHEEKSVAIMKSYFENKEIAQVTIKAIEECIMVTKPGAVPKTLLQKIIADADTYHVGTTEFTNCDENVWRELELRTKKPVLSKIEKSIKFLEEHVFHTDYCKSKITKIKNYNYCKLKRKTRE